MSDEVMNWVSELFFMIKEFGKGMGFGLFFVCIVIDYLGGMICFDFKLGLGICVMILFLVIEL